MELNKVKPLYYCDYLQTDRQTDRLYQGWGKASSIRLLGSIQDL